MMRAFSRDPRIRFPIEVRCAEMSDVTRIYLVRHGATDANQQRPYVLQGNGTDRPLNALGRAQARAAAAFLSRQRIDHVYSSDLARARETAETIADAHRLTVNPVTALREVHVGLWEGLPWDDIMERFPEDYARFMENPAEHAYLGGESYSDVWRRASPALEEIAARHTGQTVLVVAHNVVNRVLLAPLMGVPLREAKSIRQSNTGINVIRSHGAERELVTLNACFHLDHIDLPSDE